MLVEYKMKKVKMFIYLNNGVIESYNVNLKVDDYPDANEFVTNLFIGQHLIIRDNVIFINNVSKVGHQVIKEYTTTEEVPSYKFDFND